MKNEINVLYHRDCADGFGTAWAAYQHLGTEGVRYHSCVYNEPPPDMVRGSRVYILDFSFSRSVMLEMARQHEVVVLDHHETAERDIGDLPYCHFDASRSGAVLAWQWFHQGSKTPELLQYVEDRDLWKWELPESHEVSAALASHPKEFAVWDQLEIPELAGEGKAILRYNRLQVDRIVQDAGLRDIAGWEVPVVNTSLLVSEACEALLQNFPDAPFAAAYYEKGDQRRWSLRSRQDFDVSEVARLMGGGGHPQASGFLERTMPPEDPQGGGNRGR